MPVVDELSDLFARQAVDPHAPAATWTTVLGHVATADRTRRDHDRVRERNAAIAVAVAAMRVADQIDRTL